MAEALDALAAALADRYTVQRELGRGGMATVYLAEDTKLGRLVAIKVLKPELAAVVGPERFLREVKISARLEHPHILSLHDSGEAAGLLYCVMPYVEGESLRDRLNREKQLPLEDALRIAGEVADALSYAHSCGVIHRDIKPENILLEHGHAVVADFGIARAIAVGGNERLTETGLAIGTPMYMSPEQAVGSGDLDGRSDLYSLGCVLYEMLSGDPPYTGATPQAVLARKLNDPLPRISVVRETVPEPVRRALERALARTAADRFPTVAQFVAAMGADAVQPGGLARRWPGRRTAMVGMTALGVIAIAVGLVRWIRSGPAGLSHPRTSIAVLPFQNLSADGSHAYFASGLHDEVLTQLAKVATLSVRARTSVMGQVRTARSIRQVADELQVGAIVEGSVQVVGDRLRVTVQLIDVATDEPLWAERYDRTVDDAFAVQSNIAAQIVAAVGVAVSEAEASAIAAVPTGNPEAYRLYLQGLEFFRRPGYARQDLAIAQQLFERALAVDSTFALAHAALSEVHGYVSWFRYDPSLWRLERQREEAEAALRLAPDLPHAHIAMGAVHHLADRDWPRALREFQIALRGLPNDAYLVGSIGYLQRRRGNWEEVLSAFTRVTELDPLNATEYFDLGGLTLTVTRRYAEAVKAYDRALVLAPDLEEAVYFRGWTFVVWQGVLDSVRTAVERLPRGGRWLQREAALLLWERKPDSLLALLENSAEALLEDWNYLRPAALYAAWAHQLRNDGTAAHTAFDSALVLLDSLVVTTPDDHRVHIARGLALAGQGRRREARQEARWLEQSAVYRKDAHHGALVAEERAQILAQAGETAAALDAIEDLLGKPSWLSVHTLRLDPLWDPLRTHPRFQRLLKQYRN